MATNAGLTCYWVTPGRGFADATATITADYDGIIVRDGYVVYNHYDKATHQTCLAHDAARAVMRRGGRGPLWEAAAAPRMSA